MGNPNHRIGKVTTMEEFKAAVRRMQRYAGLNETGDFSDPRTLALVKANRCGVSDLGPSDNTRRKRRYALQGTYWRKNVSQLVCVLRFIKFSDKVTKLLGRCWSFNFRTFICSLASKICREGNSINSSKLSVIYV